MKRLAITFALALAVVGCADPAPPPQGITAVSPPPTATPSAAPSTAPSEEPLPSVEEVPTPEFVANAVPFNEYGTVGDWKMRVVKTNFNAGKALAKANQFNDIPPKGTVAVMAYIQYVYEGEGRASFDPLGTLGAVGDGGVEYDQFSGQTCGVLPEPDLALEDPTLRTGGSAKGWGACFIVAKADADSLMMFWSDDYGIGDDLTEFALR